jgi:D-2-hydroxyacid dehydrogenase (NADP+)
MIGEQHIRQMQPTAYLYNVGRAATTDEQAVIRALREGWIAGAALDVFDQEPLPPDSPLWTLPNAIVTPHIAGERPGSWDDLARVYTENLRRYLDGEPLLHTVDVVRGY